MVSRRVVLNLPSPRNVIIGVVLFAAVTGAAYYAYNLNKKVEKLNNDVASLRNENHELRSAIKSQTTLDNEMIQAVVKFYDEYTLAGDQTIEGLFQIADEVDTHSAQIEELKQATLMVAEQVDTKSKELDAAQKNIDLIFASLSY